MLTSKLRTKWWKLTVNQLSKVPCISIFILVQIKLSLDKAALYKFDFFPVSHSWRAKAPEFLWKPFLFYRMWSGLRSFRMAGNKFSPVAAMIEEQAEKISRKRATKLSYFVRN